MPGFKHRPKTFTLRFDDPELEGLEVKVRSLSIREVENDDIKIFEQFADALIEWNLEDQNGEPLPPTLESVRSYPDYEFMSNMANTWFRALTGGVDKDLGKGSSSGQPFPEGNIPMEPLSLNQAS